jgi:hypothetical protein
MATAIYPLSRHVGPSVCAFAPLRETRARFGAHRRTEAEASSRKGAKTQRARASFGIEGSRRGAEAHRGCALRATRSSGGGRS